MQETLPVIDAILQDCQESAILYHYFAIFKEQFKKCGNLKKEDLDRLISILQVLRQISQDQLESFTDEERLGIGLSFAQARLKKYIMNRDEHDTEKEGGILVNNPPEMLEVSM